MVKLIRLPGILKALSFCVTILVLGCSSKKEQDNKQMQQAAKKDNSFSDQFANKLVLAGAPLRNTSLIANDSIIYYVADNRSLYFASIKDKNSSSHVLRLNNPLPFAFAYDVKEVYFPAYGRNEVVKMNAHSRDTILRGSGMLYPQGVFMAAGKVIVPCLNGLFIFHKANLQKALVLPHTSFPDLNSYMPLLVEKENLYVSGIKDSVNQHQGFNVYRIDLDGSKFIWRTLVKGSGRNGLVSDSTSLFVQTEDALYCINKQSGGVEWTHAARSTLNNPVVLGNKLICKNNNSLECLDVSSGRTVWKINPGNRDGLYFFKFNNSLYANFDGTLQEINSDNGRPSKSYKIAAIPSVVVAENKSYILIGNTLYW